MVLLLHLGLMYCSIGCKVSEAHPKLPAHQTVCPHQTRYCGKKQINLFTESDGYYQYLLHNSHWCICRNWDKLKPYASLYICQARLWLTASESGTVMVFVSLRRVPFMGKFIGVFVHCRFAEVMRSCGDSFH